MQQTLIHITVNPMNKRNQDQGEPSINGISRREAIILGAAGAAAISFPSITRAKSGTNNLNLPLIPLTITNETGADVYMYAFGTLVQGIKRTSVYISNINGDVQALPLNAGLAACSVKLPAKVTNANFPQLEGVRIYFSVGEPLPVTSTGPTGLPNALVGWINSPQHPEFPLLWDWVELNWPQLSDRSLLVGNITQVQMFGLAFKLVLNGFNPAKPTEPLTFTNGFASGGLRAKIIEEIKAAGAPWSNLIINNPAFGGVPLRVLQPGSAIAPPGGPAIVVPLFPKDQLFDYINNVILPFNDTSTKNRLVAAHIVVYLEWEENMCCGNFIFVPTH